MKPCITYNGEAFSNVHGMLLVSNIQQHVQERLSAFGVSAKLCKCRHWGEQRTNSSHDRATDSIQPADCTPPVLQLIRATAHAELDCHTGALSLRVEMLSI